MDYAVKLARTPGRITEEDLAPLRRVGLQDRDIHDLCAVASYYCFVNRMANGLGVELEEETEASGTGRREGPTAAPVRRSR